MKFSLAGIKSIAVLLSVSVFAIGILFSQSSGSVNAAADDVVATYKAKCASCHGLDGSGNTVTGKKLKVRDLRSAEVQKMTDAQLQAVIAKGKGKMPAYEKALGAEQVKQLTAYTRQLAKKG